MPCRVTHPLKVQGRPRPSIRGATDLFPPSFCKHASPSMVPRTSAVLVRGSPQQTTSRVTPSRWGRHWGGTMFCFTGTCWGAEGGRRRRDRLLGFGEEWVLRGSRLGRRGRWWPAMRVVALALPSRTRVPPGRWHAQRKSSSKRPDLRGKPWGGETVPEGAWGCGDGRLTLFCPYSVSPQKAHPEGP